jgi:hypothetical protein
MSGDPASSGPRPDLSSILKFSVDDDSSEHDATTQEMRWILTDSIDPAADASNELAPGTEKSTGLSVVLASRRFTDQTDAQLQSANGHLQRAEE